MRKKLIQMFNFFFKSVLHERLSDIHVKNCYKIYCNLVQQFKQINITNKLIFLSNLRKRYNFFE